MDGVTPLNSAVHVIWFGEVLEKSTVKPVVSSHSKIDKTKVSKTNGSLMKVESIAKCSLGTFCNTLDLH